MSGQKAQFPVISKPKAVGEFGNDYKTNEVHIGRSKISYLYEPSLQQRSVYFDLNHGFEAFKQKPYMDEKLDQLLKYIMAVSESGSNLQKNIHDSGFVTWRGALTKIAATPFLSQNSDPWRIVACKFSNVIFLCEFPTESWLLKRGNETPLQKRQTYWGHKFEQYVTGDTINAIPDTSGPVSTFENYCGVFKLQAKSKRERNIAIYMGAEMDGIDSHGDFIELKTQFKQLGLGKFWNEKAMKMWLQSYLVGIERIIVGLRNNDGIVERLQEVKTHDLRQNRTNWDPATCMNYLLDYCDNVKSRLDELLEGRLVFTEYLPSTKSLTVRTLEEFENDSFKFIPDYFIQHFINE